MRFGRHDEGREAEAGRVLERPGDVPRGAGRGHPHRAGHRADPRPGGRRRLPAPPGPGRRAHGGGRADRAHLLPAVLQGVERRRDDRRAHAVLRPGEGHQRRGHRPRRDAPRQRAVGRRRCHP
ncbi:hypothetical protein G5V59_26705 [Nocardioides sp. W3-2-3]|uniref:hypothetical protein n=1 Tax=Nocardioides convexus TaxID=2712224 RepID=UPI002418B03A|nr:hypothetical protein [Nocardioides convexus]NHA01989.1 hypothetical protein [Nocardioides convexus]